MTESFPEILDERIPDDNAPSCSVRMSLAAQGLFVNDAVVTFAAQLLYELFSRGQLAAHGVMVNLGSFRSAPIDVNPEVGGGIGLWPARSHEPRRKSRIFCKKIFMFQ